MKIFIPSYNRANFIGTQFSTMHQLEQCGWEQYQVVVRPSQYNDYKAVVPRKHLLVMDSEGGLNAAREFVRQFVRRGQWCLHMDDNVRGFIMPTARFYQANQEVPLRKDEKMITRSRWQRIMSVSCSFYIFYSFIVQDTVDQAEARGACLAGFSAHENPAFRPRKYTDVGYVCGKVMLMKNTGLPWCQSTASAGEDYALTAAHLYEHGRVLVNKWGHPTRVHYMPGGCGPYEERLPEMLRMQQELLARYGDLFSVKKSKHQGELRLRFNSLSQVEQWRSNLHYDPNYRIGLRNGKPVPPAPRQP